MPLKYVLGDEDDDDEDDDEDDDNTNKKKNNNSSNNNDDDDDNNNNDNDDDDDDDEKSDKNRNNHVNNYSDNNYKDRDRNKNQSIINKPKKDEQSLRNGLGSSLGPQRSRTPLQHIFRPDLSTAEIAPCANSSSNPLFSHQRASKQLPTDTVRIIDLTRDDVESRSRIIGKRVDNASSLALISRAAQSQGSRRPLVKDSSDSTRNTSPANRVERPTPVWTQPGHPEIGISVYSADSIQKNHVSDTLLQAHQDLSPVKAGKSIQSGTLQTWRTSKEAMLAKRSSCTETATTKSPRVNGYRPGDATQETLGDQGTHGSCAMENPKRALKTSNHVPEAQAHSHPYLKVEDAKVNDIQERVSDLETEIDDVNARMHFSGPQASTMYSSVPQKTFQFMERFPSVEGNENPGEEERNSEILKRRPWKSREVQKARESRSTSPRETNRYPRSGNDLNNRGDAAASASRPETISTLDSHSPRTMPLGNITPAPQSRTPSPFAKPIAESEEPRQHGNERDLMNTNHISLAGKAVNSPDMKVLEAILKSIIEQTKVDQEFLISSLLSRARSEVNDSRRPDLDNSLPDPFACVQGVPIDQPASTNSLPRIRMESRSLNSRSRSSLIESRAVPFRSAVQRLPGYNSITRLGSNVLARNDKELKYLPYFPQEERDGEDSINSERREELLQAFDDRVNSLAEERRCSEQAEFWRESTEDLLAKVGCSSCDVIYYLLHDRDSECMSQCQLTQEALARWRKKETFCESCGTNFHGGEWTRLSETRWESKPNPKTLAVAGLVCSVFASMMGFSIWHIASTDPAVECLLQDRKTKSRAEPQQRHRTQSLCMLCHVFDCPHHGAYLEELPWSIDDDANKSQPHRSDRGSSTTSAAESDSHQNVRQNVALAERLVPERQQHMCGVFCVDPGTPCCEILATHEDDGVKGRFNTNFEEGCSDPGFDDDETCSRSCFWDAATRSNDKVGDLVHPKPVDRFVNWGENEVKSYQSMLATCLVIRRGPCIMASLLEIPCSQIFREMLVDIHTVPHPSPDLELSVRQPSVCQSTAGSKERIYGWESSLIHDHHKRAPFIPCSHSGPCDRNVNCICWSSKVACEWICGCDRSCRRRFYGCKCVARGSKVCFLDSSCECFALDRECDPWLCGDCGVDKVLDPANRSNDQIQSGRCRNANIQRNIPKRTLKGPSDIHGWGLFAGEDVGANDFVGEYKGEIISEEESNRRGLVYHYRGLEYLFRLNKTQEIDASRAGNKMRYINNSQRPSTINVYAKTMLCNGVQRIGLFARRNLVTGEEMFFRYGYPASVTKNFWEKEDLEAHGRDEGKADTEPHDKFDKPDKSDKIGRQTKARRTKTRRGVGKHHQKNLNKSGPKQSTLRDIADPQPDGSGPHRQENLSTSRPQKRKRRSSPPLTIDDTTFGLPPTDLHPSGIAAQPSPSSSRCRTYGETAVSDTERDDDDYYDSGQKICNPEEPSEQTNEDDEGEAFSESAMTATTTGSSYSEAEAEAEADSTRSRSRPLSSQNSSLRITTSNPHLTRSSKLNRRTTDNVNNTRRRGDDNDDDGGVRRGDRSHIARKKRGRPVKWKKNNNNNNNNNKG